MGPFFPLSLGHWDNAWNPRLPSQKSARLLFKSPALVKTTRKKKCNCLFFKNINEHCSILSFSFIHFFNKFIDFYE